MFNNEVIPEATIKIVTPEPHELPKSFQEVVAETIINLQQRVYELADEVTKLQNASDKDKR